MRAMQAENRTIQGACGINQPAFRVVGVQNEMFNVASPEMVVESMAMCMNCSLWSKR